MMEGNCRGIMMEMVRVKAEPLYTDVNFTDGSVEAKLEELYLGHEIKDELVIGPEVLQLGDAIFTEPPRNSYNSQKNLIHQDHTYVKTARTDIKAELALQKRIQKAEERSYHTNLAKNGPKKRKISYEVKTAKLINQAKVEYHKKMAKLDHQAKRHKTKAGKLGSEPKLDCSPAEDTEVQFVCEVPALLPAEPAFDDSCVLVRAPAPALAHVVKVEPVVEQDACEAADVLFSQVAPEQPTSSDSHSPTPSHPTDESHHEDMNNIDLQVFSNKTKNNMSSVLPLDISEKQMDLNTNRPKAKINKRLLREIYLLHGLTKESENINLKSVLKKSNNESNEDIPTGIYEPLNTLVCQSEHEDEDSYQEPLDRTNQIPKDDEINKINLKTDDLHSTDDNHTETRMKRDDFEFPGLLKVRSTQMINDLVTFPEADSAVNFQSRRSYPEYPSKSQRSGDHSVKSQRNSYYESLNRRQNHNLPQSEPTDYENFIQNSQRSILNNSRTSNENSSRRKLNKSLLSSNYSSKFTEDTSLSERLTNYDNKLNTLDYRKRNAYENYDIEYAEKGIDNKDNYTNSNNVVTECKTDNDNTDLNLSSYKTDKVIYYSDYESFFLKSVDHNKEDLYGGTEESKYTSQDSELDYMPYENCDENSDENGDSEIVASYTEIGECVCALCHEKFADKAELLEHVMVHIHMSAIEKQDTGLDGNVSGEAPSANKQRKTKPRQRMKLGRASVLAPKPQYYPCNLCDTTFFKYYHLVQHRKIHTNMGERPFFCQHCKKTFAHSVNLRQHLKIHTGQKYTCNVCKKHFYRRSNLKSHQRIHTGEKPYSCKVCQRTFSQRRCLKKHELIHTGDVLPVPLLP